MEDKLKKLLDNSYTPYYNYPVASIVIMKDGQEFCGVNVETSSPAAGICAERNALYTAITMGYGKGDVKEMHVMSKSSKYCFPCFICRQAINDLCDSDVVIYSHTYDGEVTGHKVVELCTFPFDNDDVVNL